MLLQNKNAIVYGAGGSLGGAIARALAAAGAKVFLTGRNAASVQKTADEIIAAGGKAEVDVVDALDGKAIARHMDKVVKQAGKVDISFNAIGLEDKQDIALVEMDMEDFVRPVMIAMQTQFLTATAAGRMMMKQGSGTILTLTATPGGIGYPYTGGFSAACCAVECFTRNLASELGPYGARAVNIRSAGSPDSRVFRQVIESDPEAMEPVLRSMKNDTMLKELPLMADIAHTAVFLASDMAGKITGVTVDVTCGTTSALNYRASGKESTAFPFK